MTRYKRDVQAKLKRVRKDQRARILAIETSCDETAAAVVEKRADGFKQRLFIRRSRCTRRTAAWCRRSPSRSHVQKIGAVVSPRAGGSRVNATGIGPRSRSPTDRGLVGALLVGLSYAKGPGLCGGVCRFLGVHHIASHIAANYLSYPDLQPPFYLPCGVRRGTAISSSVEDYERYRLLGRTRGRRGWRGRSIKWRACWACPIPAAPNLEQLALEGGPGPVSVPLRLQRRRGV